jgi:hypothetical protein
MGPARPAAAAEPKPATADAYGSAVVEFRRRPLLPPEDVLGCLREAVPALSRSALHRCPVRHGISRPPRDEEKTSKRKRFAQTTIGYIRLDNFAKHLNAPRWRTPFEAISDAWTKDPAIFRSNPHHLIPGANT